MAISLIVDRITSLTGYRLYGIILCILCTAIPGYSLNGPGIKHDVTKITLNTHQAALTEMEYHNGRLSVQACSIPVKQMIEKLARKTDIKVVWQGPEQNDPVSLGFTDRSIEEAISEILYGKNYVLSYKSFGNRQVIGTIIILPGSDKKDKVDMADRLPQNHTTAAISNGPEIMQLQQETEQAGNERIKQIETVKEMALNDEREQAADHLTIALAENKEPEARLLALNSLNELGAVSTDMLIESLSIEGDPRVKLQAVDYLIKRAGEDPMIEGILTAFFEREMSTAVPVQK